MHYCGVKQDIFHVHLVSPNVLGALAQLETNLPRDKKTW